MTKILGCLVATVLMLPNFAKADASYSDSSATVTHDCGKDVNAAFDNASSTITIIGECDNIAINGASNKITIVSAKKVAITGASNEVAIEAAGKIAVTGSANIVTYVKGLGKAKAPKVAKTGVGNSVKKVKPAAAK